MKSRLEAKQNDVPVLRVICNPDLSYSLVILLLEDCITSLKWEVLNDVEIIRQ